MACLPPEFEGQAEKKFLTSKQWFCELGNRDYYYSTRPENSPSSLN
jgi:hypothetical protein